MDGIVFHSKHEMEQYRVFKSLLSSGAIQGLELQVRYPICINSVKVCDYIADFVVYEKNGVIRIYDAKGYKTEMYKLKKKMFEAYYAHLRIVEI